MQYNNLYKLQTHTLNMEKEKEDSIEEGAKTETEEKEGDNKLVKFLCKNCKSSNTYATKKEQVCRHCGFREKR